MKRLFLIIAFVYSIFFVVLPARAFAPFIGMAVAAVDGASYLLAGMAGLVGLTGLYAMINDDAGNSIR